MGSLTEQLQRGIDLHAEKARLYETQNKLNEDARKSMESKVNGTLGNYKIDDTTTLNVGPNRTFKDIRSAFDSLRGKQIKGYVVIKVDDGVHKTTGIHLEHQPYASRIMIEGNKANPERCVIQFVPDRNKRSHGLVIRRLKGLRIAGFKFVGEVTPDNFTYRAIRVDYRSFVTIDENTVQIEGTRIGVEVSNTSTLYANGLKITQHTYWGVIVGIGSEVHMHRAEIHGVGKDARTPRYYDPDTPHKDVCGGIYAKDTSKCWSHKSIISGVWYGFLAARNTYLWCDSSVVQGAHKAFLSQLQSTLWPHINNDMPAKAIDCDYGFIAEHMGLIWAPGAIAENCKHIGFYAYSSSKLFCNDATAKNCGKGFFSNVNAEVEASGTNSKSTGNTEKYSPPASGTVGNTNAIIRWS